MIEFNCYLLKDKCCFVVGLYHARFWAIIGILDITSYDEVCCRVLVCCYKIKKNSNCVNAFISTCTSASLSFVWCFP